MDFWELLVVAVGLAADAFAVSVCKGLSARERRWSGALACGLYFGGFQALMPVAGYLIGISFYELIMQYDHWVVFGLLSLIGINMIREAREKPGSCEPDEECRKPDFHVREMLMLALATSIDALAVGVSFAFARVPILQAAILIGIVTFFTSFAGVGIGQIFGAKFKSWAVITGGLMLIGIGLKTLAEHLAAI